MALVGFGLSLSACGGASSDTLSMLSTDSP